MDVPIRPCEELLKNQFEAAAHATHATESSKSAADSWTLVLATHNRTSEAVRTLRAAYSPTVATTPPRDVIVYIDESQSDGEKTEAALFDSNRQVRFLHGDGNTYWSRSLRALLDEAMTSDVDYVVHVNTDVSITAPIDALLEPLRADRRVAGVAGVLTGPGHISGYRSIHAWFPFFRSVKAGHDAAILPASYVAYRVSALRSPDVDLRALDDYRHGWADVELSLQLRAAGYRLATTKNPVGAIEHTRYFRRQHHFERYGGSLLRYVRECPTAPCLSDTRRIGRRLFGHFWPVLLRVYVPVSWQWLRFRAHRVRS